MSLRLSVDLPSKYFDSGIDCSGKFMAKCSACGIELSGDVRFCPSCGRPASNTDDAATLDFATATSPLPPRPRSAVRLSVQHDNPRPRTCFSPGRRYRRRHKVAGVNQEECEMDHSTAIFPIERDRITIESANESGDRSWVPHPRPARRTAPERSAGRIGAGVNILSN